MAAEVSTSLSVVPAGDDFLSIKAVMPGAAWWLADGDDVFASDSSEEVMARAAAAFGMMVSPTRMVEFRLPTNSPEDRVWVFVDPIMSESSRRTGIRIKSGGKVRWLLREDGTVLSEERPLDAILAAADRLAELTAGGNVVRFSPVQVHRRVEPPPEQPEEPQPEPKAEDKPKPKPKAKARPRTRKAQPKAEAEAEQAEVSG